MNINIEFKNLKVWQVHAIFVVFFIFIGHVLTGIEMTQARSVFYFIVGLFIGLILLVSGVAIFVNGHWNKRICD